MHGKINANRILWMAVDDDFHWPEEICGGWSQLLPFFRYHLEQLRSEKTASNKCVFEQKC